MACDERLVERVRTALRSWVEFEERRMFGGVCFLVRGRMCCGVIKNLLVLRLGPELAGRALSHPHTRLMDFTGKPMKGMLYVEPAGTRTGTGLQRWLEQAVAFGQTLPKKGASPRA